MLFGVGAEGAGLFFEGLLAEGPVGGASEGVRDRISMGVVSRIRAGWDRRIFDGGGGLSGGGRGSSNGGWATRRMSRLEAVCAMLYVDKYSADA